MLSHHPDHSPRPSCHCGARAFSFTSFTSFASLTSAKSFTIRTSKTPLPQVLYNPHLQAPLGSAGNTGLITPLESALTKNSPVTPVESALTKRWGVGATLPLGNSPLVTRHLQPDSSSLIFIRFQALLCSPKNQLFCFHTIPASLRKTPGVGAVSYRMVSISASRETWVAGKPLIENFWPPDSEK